MRGSMNELDPAPMSRQTGPASQNRRNQQNHSSVDSKTITPQQHQASSQPVFQKQQSSIMTNQQKQHQHPLPINQEEEYIPLPIQTFLWRNTNPFVKPREKRESGNVIEQRDSCKLFERIIITNNVWGQSPSLTDAIASIDRWRLIKVSFPFVLQSTANQLNNKFIRDYTLNKMGSNESKMLYCLQWILMNASEECADSENEAKSSAIAALGGASALLKPLGAVGLANSSNSGSASISPAGVATSSNLAAGCLTGVAAVAAGIAVGQALVSQGSTSSTSTNLGADSHGHQPAVAATTIVTPSTSSCETQQQMASNTQRVSATSAQGLSTESTTTSASTSSSAPLTVISALNQSIIKMPGTSAAVAVAIPSTMVQQASGVGTVNSPSDVSANRAETMQVQPASSQLEQPDSKTAQMNFVRSITTTTSVSPIGSPSPTKPLTPINQQPQTHPQLQHQASSSNNMSACMVPTATSQTIINNSNNYNYLLPISSIQMFVYYFAPLMEPLEMSDFLKSNQRLEIGVALWEPLFNHQLPNVQCLNAPVKMQNQLQLLQQWASKQNQQQFYKQKQYHSETMSSSGSKLTSRHQQQQHQQPQDIAPPTTYAPGVNDAIRRRSSAAVTSGSSHTAHEHQQHQLHQTQHQQSQFGDVFIGGPNNSSGPPPHKAQGGQKQQQITQSSQVSSLTQPQSIAKAKQGVTLATTTSGEIGSALSDKADTECLAATPTIGEGDSQSADPIDSQIAIANYATYLDVAVLRCLFMNNWQESGVFWALRYTSKRIDQFDYSDAKLCLRPIKVKSKSVPNLYTAGLQYLKLNQKTCEQLLTQQQNAIDLIQITEDFMRDYLKVTNNNSNDHYTQYDNHLPGSVGKQASTQALNFKKSHQQSKALNNKNRKSALTLNEQHQSSSKLAKPFSQHRSSRRSSSAEDLTAKQVTDLTISKSTASSKQTKRSATKELLIDDLDLASSLTPRQDDNPTITIRPHKSSKFPRQKSEQYQAQQQHTATQSTMSIDKQNQIDQMDPIASIAKADQQFLIHSLYLKSLRRLDKITRSFSVPKDMNYRLSTGQQFGFNNSSSVSAPIEESPESLAASNYIDSKGRIDPIIILKLVHAIAQRDSVCSLRVCNELLTLVCKLIEIGILDDNYHLNMARESCSKEPNDLANLLPTREQDYTMLTDLENQEYHQNQMGGRPSKSNYLLNYSRKSKLQSGQQMTRRQLEEASGNNIQVFKMLIDITLYLYHHSGCPNNCGLESIMDHLQHGVQNHKIKFISATVKQPSQAASSQNIIAEDQFLDRLFKPKLRKMLVTLYQHDEQYFIKYLKLIIQSRTLQEVVDILHSILGFCRSDYIVSLTQLTSQYGQSAESHPVGPSTSKSQSTDAPQQHQHHQHHHQQTTVQFCNVLDSPLSQGNDSMSRVGVSAAAAAAAAASPSGESSGPLVEAEIINSVLKLLITRMANVNKKLKLQEHTSLYCDIRRLIAFVRDNYNGTFRRILLSSLIDCTKIMNEQQRHQQKLQQDEDLKQQHFTEPSFGSRCRVDGSFGGAHPSDDETGPGYPTTKRPHHYHSKQSQSDNLEHERSGISRSSPVASGSELLHHHQSPIKDVSGGPRVAHPSSSAYIINDQQQLLYQRNSQSSDRYGSNVNVGDQYHKSSASIIQEQQQREQTSGILSLSKAKKKLEQVFGAKTTPTNSTNIAASLSGISSSGSKPSKSHLNYNNEDLMTSNMMTTSTSAIIPNVGYKVSCGADGISNDDPSRRTSIIGNQSVASIQHHDSITTTTTNLNIRGSQMTSNLNLNNNPNQTTTHGNRSGSPEWSSANPNLPLTPGPYSLLGSLQAGGNLMSRRLFDAMHNGMTNFSFLMESSSPGEFLDPALLAALLDLKSPIAIRAAIFLECSNLVHRCNRGQWPSWMKMNMAYSMQQSHHHSQYHQSQSQQQHLSLHRPSSVGLGNQSQLGSTIGSAAKFRKSSSIQRNVRNNTLMYRAAGKAFYSWAEAIGVRLEEMLLTELDQTKVQQEEPSTKPEHDQSSTGEQRVTTNDQTIRKQTSIINNANKDYNTHNNSISSGAIEASQANAGGNVDFFQPTLGNTTSPFALKMAACQLLFEVTTFLRETYRYLPPSIANHQVVGSKLGDKMSSIYDVSRAVTANRRWSMALSSLGFGQLPATLSALSTSPGPTTQQVNAVINAANVSNHLKTPGDKQHQQQSTTSSIPEHPSERRISFILHESNNEDDNNSDSYNNDQSGTNEQQQQAPLATVVTTNDQQQEAIRKMTGRNLSQSSASNAVVVAAATCLLRSSGMIDSQPHRRKSIKLKKRDDKDSGSSTNSALASGVGSGGSGGAVKKVTKFAPAAELTQPMDEEGTDSSSLVGGGDGLRRTDSLRSRRRVSGISEKSDVSEPKTLNDLKTSASAGSSAINQQTGNASNIIPGSVNQHHQDLSADEGGSLGNNSCEDVYGQESVDRFEQDQSRIMSNMPWFKAISLINSKIDCECIHFPNCRPDCYKLHQNMCKRLILSVQTIYSSGAGDDEANLTAIFEAKLAALVNQHATTTLATNTSETNTKHNHHQHHFARTGSDCSANTLTNDDQSQSNKSDLPIKHKKPGRSGNKYNVDDVIGTPKNQGYNSKQQMKQPYSSGSSSAPMRQLDPNHASLLETLRALNLYKSNQSSASKKKQHQQSDELPILRYIRISVKNFLYCPMSAFLKGAVILSRESFVEMIRFSWNLLLEDDQQLSRTAAVCFIISSIKCPGEATELLMNELASTDASKKIAAINKFHVVWDARYQCWPRLEDGAFVHFKMAPPSIEFTLPSPKIAQESKPVVDPPWMPRKTSNVEEVTIGQDQTVQRSFVTATKTRRKQQIEIVNRALREKHDKLRQGRESYHITSVPVTLYAAYEPTLGVNQPGSDDPEAVGGGGGGGNSGTLDDDTTQQESRALIQMKTAQALFPTCLCQAAIVLINLLDDSRVTYEGSAVYEVANKVIWSCLVEDPSLFLRYFFERLTRQNQSTIFQVLRRLIRFMPKLPPQAAFTLYNYLIGFVIYYIRSPVAISQKLIGETLSVLCFVVPSVYALFLKDLKQIFRKEQCDNALLITANVPSAKKIIVHGSDSSGIPSQFPIDESTQFYHILIDSLEFFGIKKDKQNDYFLIDVRTNQMHNLHSYVRDHYSFKRSQHPQLQLISMNPDKAFHILQSQELTNQFLEFGKVLMTHQVVKSSHMAVGRALFLHEELMKLPTFPRRALETNFSLFRGTTGHQVFSMDRMHKVCWVKAISRMFELTSGFFLQLGEIHLFLNAISGVFVLHCEEAAVSRLCLATFINAAHHFKNIFATDGFTPIMSTIVQVYSNHQNNHLLCRSIEFVCKQFYIMHRKPFLLQLFGSVASRLNTAEILHQNQTNNPISANTYYTSSSAGSSGGASSARLLNQNTSSISTSGGNSGSGGAAFDLGDPNCISPNAFFRLLQSLEKAFKDPLDILELVEAEKPLRAVDFCYQQDKEIIDILDIISLCVTVTAYASDSPRSTQMLIILETVVPLYMKHLQAATSKKAGQSMGKQAHKDELQKIQSISVCIRTLIVNCDGLTRSFSGPLPYIDFKSSSIRRNGALSGKSAINANQMASSANARQNKRGNNNSSAPFSPGPDMYTTTEFSHSGLHMDAGRSNLLSPLAGNSSSAGSGGRQATIAPGVGSGGASPGNYNKFSRQAINNEESEITRGEFIVPRDTLLNLTAEFLNLSTIRLVESAKKYVDLHQKHSSYELLDVKSHLKLAEVANSLLKFASTDPSVMACRGLTRYMNEILPNTEWRQEAIRPALIMILKRLDKTFNRIAKKNSVKRNTDWEGAKQLLKGAYLTFIKHPYIVHLPHLKSLISCCQNIIMSDSLAASSYLLSSNFFPGLNSSSTGNQTQPASSSGTATIGGGGGNAGLGAVNRQQGIGVTTSISQSASMQMDVGGSLQQQTLFNNSNNNLLRVTSQHHASGSSLAPSNSSNHLQAQTTFDNNNNNNSGINPLIGVASGQVKSTNLPSFVTTVAAAALAERLAATAASANYSVTSQAFNSVTVRLIAMQLLQAGDSQTLESLIGNNMNTPEKLESVTLNLIYPMCIRVCSGSREAPKLRPCDITFILNVVLNMLAPHSSSSKSCSSSANSPKVTSDTSQFILNKITTTIGSSANASGAMGALGIVAGGGVTGGFGLATSHSSANANANLNNMYHQQQQQFVQHQERLKIAFLGLKILCVCFESHLAGEWIRISRVIRDLTLERNQPIGSLWDFLDFVATYRFPLLVLLIPTIKCHLARKIRQQQQKAAPKKSPVSGSTLVSPGEQLYNYNNNNLLNPGGTVISEECDDSDGDASLARYNMQCLRLIDAKISGQATTVCRSRSFLFVSLAAELRMLKEQLVAKRRAQLDGERNNNSSHHGNAGYHQHHNASGPASGTTPGGAGTSTSGLLPGTAGHRSSGGIAGPSSSGRQNNELSAGSNQDHFSTYHRLSAAIAMFANQANQAKNHQQSQAGGGSSGAPIMTSAALKASTCFAAQLAAPSVASQQVSSPTSNTNFDQQSSLLQNRSPEISQEQSQNSIRLSTAKSREEARAVMNTILRRTSYPHHNPIMGSPEHHQHYKQQDQQYQSQSGKLSQLAKNQHQVDIEAGDPTSRGPDHRGIASGQFGATPSCSSSASIQLNAASLMSAIPPPRPKNTDKTGSVLKQLVNSIDKRNKVQQQQQQQQQQERNRDNNN